MICNACGIDNTADAAKCSHCGNDLRNVEPGPRGKVCFSCGFNNPPESRFCARCGIDIKHHRAAKGHHGRDPQPQPKDRRKRDPVFRWHPAVVGLALLGVGILIAIVLQVTRDWHTPPRQAPVIEAKSQDPKLEAGVMSIAAKFICSCGSCGEKPLEICACERAIEERQFIRNALQAGQAADQIIAAVNATYGWMKPDSSGRPLSGMSLPTDLPPATASYSLLTARAVDTSGRSGNDRIATPSDRDEIFSHFKCPCGQCGMDDLRVCTCQHPHGATEVKAFVDGIIAERKLSVGQVIKKVDQEYGSRKF